jgi:fucose 4-O-acetylase-like acetyltransferase
VPGITSFAFFPWAGFVFAGGIVGLAIDALRTGRDEARLNGILLAAGLALAAGAYVGSHLPSIYAQSHFWTSAPSFFFLRAGLLIAAVGAAYAWEARPWARGRWSPLQQLGRTSLFIYWIHVELVYGLISLRLHKALTFPQALAALAAFSFLMLLASIAKDRWVRRGGKGGQAP